MGGVLAMSDFWRGYIVYACLAVTLTVVVWLALGCGPKYPPQPSVEERCMASTNPALCTIVGRQVEAEQAMQQPPSPPAYQGGPQRVFIHRWQRPGTWPNPAPLGYIDLP
jgi:hypothetical protein